MLKQPYKLQQQKNRNVSKQHKFGIKKQEHGLCVSWGLTRKSRTNHCHQLHRTNHENFVKLQRTIENNTRIQFGSAGQVINLSKKRFAKETFKLLHKNLNFVLTQTNFNKTKLNKELEEIFRRIKLKAHFKNAEKNACFTEEAIFRKLTNKTRVPNKNQNSIKTFIKATHNETNNEIEKTKQHNY